jgi:hypothetical protein
MQQHNWQKNTDELKKRFFNGFSFKISIPVDEMEKYDPETETSRETFEKDDDGARLLQDGKAFARLSLIKWN